jgi:tRNA(Ile)-lysidine synthase
MALLHLCLQAGLPVRVFHLNHQARPSAAVDAAFVDSACRALGVPCTVVAENVPELARAERRSFEATARDRRYRALDGLAGGGWAATGHTMDDQAETVLLRLVRGAGSSGLAGIRRRLVRGCTVIRPLLGFRHSELRDWLAGQGIAWREDETNADLRVPRNRVRHELLPVLARYNPRVVEALARTARLLAEEDEFLEGLTGDAPVLRRRQLKRSHPSASLAHLEQLGAPGPGALPWGPHPVACPGTTAVAEAQVVLEVARVAQAGAGDRHEVYLRPDSAPLSVRSRRDGDRFQPAGGSGSKKVKKLFIDEKVPRRERDSIPLLVTADGHIAWLVGWRADRRFIQPPGTGPAWRIQCRTGGETGG